MKKNKQSAATGSSKKAFRKDMKHTLFTRIKEVVAQLGKGSKKMEKEIEKTSSQLAKKLSKNLKKTSVIVIEDDQKAKPSAANETPAKPAVTKAKRVRKETTVSLV